MPLIIKIFVENIRDINIQTRAIFHEAQARAEDLGMVVQFSEKSRSAERQQHLIQRGKIKNSFFAGGTAFDVRINNEHQISDCKRFSEIVRNVAKQYSIAVQWSGAYEN